MTRIEKQVLIDRPLEDVFRYTRDWRNIPTYLDYVRHVEPLAEKTEGKGSRLSIDLVFLGRKMHSEWETVEYLPGDGWTYTAPLGGVVARKQWHFEPVGESTRVSFALEYQPKPPVIAPLVDKLLLRRAWDKMYARGMENLKHAVESQPAGQALEG